MSTFLQQNLAALRAAGYPVPDDPVLPADWEFAVDESGPSLRVPGASGVLVTLHSRRDPLAEAERLAASTPAGPMQSVAAVAGVGLGFVVDALERQSPDLPVVLTETAFDRLVPFLSRRDWRARIEAKRLGVFTVDNSSGSAGLRKMLEARQGELLLLVHPVFERERPREMAAAVAALGRAWNGARANRTARLAFEGLYADHTFTNLARLTRAVDVRSLQGVSRGRPAVVVGAGPSLDAQLPVLARMRDRVTLVAVDTALRPLLTAGLDPDLVVAVDPSHVNARHLLDLAPRTRAWLVGEPSLPPAVFEAFDGRIIGFRVSRNEPWPWLLAHGLDIGMLAAWGSVLVTALDFACHMESDPVVLCGADLAYTDDRPYCRHTTFGLDAELRGETEDTMAAQWMDARGPDLVSHPDLHGRPTRCPSYFPAVRDALLELAARRQPRRIVNATCAGILYGGAIEQGSLDDVIGRASELPDANTWERLPRVSRGCVSIDYEQGSSWHALTGALIDAWPHLEGRALAESRAVLRALASDHKGDALPVAGEACVRWLRPLLDSPWTAAMLRFVQALDAAAPRWFERLEAPIVDAIQEGDADNATYIRFAAWVTRSCGDGLHAPPIDAFIERMLDRLGPAAIAGALSLDIGTERAILLASFGRLDDADAAFEALCDRPHGRPLAAEMIQALFAGGRGRALVAERARIDQALSATALRWVESECAAGRDMPALWRYLIQCAACVGDTASARVHLREGLRRHPALAASGAVMALEAWTSHEQAFARELWEHAGLTPASSAPGIFQLAVADALFGDAGRAHELFGRLMTSDRTLFAPISPPNSRWFLLARAAAALGDTALERRARAAALRLDVMAGRRERVSPAVSPREVTAEPLPPFELPAASMPRGSTQVESAAPEPAPIGGAR